jgi:hypothetical protein
MNRLIAVVSIILTLPNLAFNQAGDKKLPIALPPLLVIRVLYPPPAGSVFDRMCRQLLGTQVDPEWVKEAVRRVPEFQAIWDKEGPAYLSATFAEVGIKFQYQEMQVTLTACPPVNSMSTHPADG